MFTIPPLPLQHHPNFSTPHHPGAANLSLSLPLAIRSNISPPQRCVIGGAVAEARGPAAGCAMVHVHHALGSRLSLNPDAGALASGRANRVCVPGLYSVSARASSYTGLRASPRVDDHVLRVVTTPVGSLDSSSAACCCIQCLYIAGKLDLCASVQ